MNDAVTVARLAAEPEGFSPETPPDSTPQAKILLVDDEPKSLFALQELLSTLGQNLMIAESGEEALRLALKNDFAVILLDVRMPGIDGFETARLIRSRERSRLTPVIFLTAAADEMGSMFRGYEVDRKSTRLNSSHQIISYAVFCLKKKTQQQEQSNIIQP